MSIPTRLRCPNNFYRLEQVDVDGKATYYGVLKVTIETPGKQGLQVSPNPTFGVVYLSLADPETGTLQVRLTDMQGSTLRGWTFSKPAETWNGSIDLSGLPAGTYVLQIKGTTIREVQTIVKQ